MSHPEGMHGMHPRLRGVPLHLHIFTLVDQIRDGLYRLMLVRLFVEESTVLLLCRGAVSRRVVLDRVAWLSPRNLSVTVTTP